MSGDFIALALNDKNQIGFVDKLKMLCMQKFSFLSLLFLVSNRLLQLVRLSLVAAPCDWKAA